MHSEHDAFGIDDVDVYLWDTGGARRAYEVFGCHRMDGDLWRFSVWAPGAREVSVVGDFNGWDGSSHPMQRTHNGIWVAFAEHLEWGMAYKFRVVGADGVTRLKADPFALHAENGLATASKVWELNGYEWGDADWLERRAHADLLHEPVSIYELHLGSWRLPWDRALPNYREVADQLADYCCEMGYTHVELMPINEHPFPKSWGYQTTGYFAVESRFGTPQDFMYFVDRMHRAGIGVICDWVPAHFPRDEWALARFDGTPLFEYADPRKGENAEWGTLVFDYTKPAVVSFLVSSANLLLDVYHVDGIRVDAVSSMLYLDYARTEWVPNVHGGNINLEAVEFLRTLNTALLTEHPGATTFAEESTAFPKVTAPPYDGGLGFNFKWGMGFMHDTLDYMACDPLWRAERHSLLTQTMTYAFSENYVLSFSHDEVVYGKGSMIAKMPGDYWQKFASLRTLMGFTFAHPGKKLIFMGSEFAQFDEWNYERELEWFLLDYPAHAQMQRYMAELNAFYRAHPALWRDEGSWAGFTWANYNDRDECAIAFLRSTGADDGICDIVCCCNFTPVARQGFVVGLPGPGELEWVFSSAEERFGGTCAPHGHVEVVEGEFEGHPYHACIPLAPLSAGYLEFTPTKSHNPLV